MGPYKTEQCIRRSLNMFENVDLWGSSSSSRKPCASRAHWHKKHTQGQACNTGTKPKYAVSPLFPGE